jgi:hypothetical protein
MWAAIAGLLVSCMVSEAQPKPSARQPDASQSFFKGTVVEVLAPQLFSIRPEEGQPPELLVLAPRELATEKGATVAVTGTLHRVTDREVQQMRGWSALDAQLRNRLGRRPIILASAVLSSVQNIQPEEPAAPPEAPAAPAVTERPPAAPGPLPLPASTLVEFIQTFAGQPVRIQNARVVGLISPDVFLIEPATRYLKDMGERDRMAVFVNAGSLRVSPDLLVGSIVELDGVARTVLSVQASGDVSWPTRLNQETVERLEIRAAILASSVHTAEGTELTGRPPSRQQ